MTYEAPLVRRADSVGKLRRLALMPLEIINKGKYDSPKDQVAAAQSYEDICANFLTRDKGYEIARVRDADGKWQNDLLDKSENSSIQELYREWHKEKAEKHTASVIQKIGRALNVDGVLVVRITERKMSLAEGGLWACLNIALLNIPLFYLMISADKGAWIYETATGRLVWYEERSAIADERSPITVSLSSLFRDMENAVPRQLIK